MYREFVHYKTRSITAFLYTAQLTFTRPNLSVTLWILASHLTPRMGVVALRSHLAAADPITRSLCSRHGVDDNARRVHRSDNWRHAAANSDRLHKQVGDNNR